MVCKINVGTILSISLLTYAVITTNLCGNALHYVNADHDVRADPHNSTEACTMAMYGNDTAAYWACLTQFAHQANWFPSPISGLFSYEVWNGYDGFWQNGAVLETMTNFIDFTGKTHMRYVSPLKNSLRDLYSLLEAYGPEPSFDDMSWYALAYIRIHEVLAFDTFLKTAEEIYNWCWKSGWDTTYTCHGGMWFDDSLQSKQTITNAQMLMLSAKLYRLTKKSVYIKNMNLIYEFIIKTDLINTTTYMVSDGATPNCTAADEYNPTYNAGVMIGAFVEMFKVTNITSYLELAYKLANGIFENYCDADGILVEPCEPKCDDDALMYKGLFVRNLRYLIDILKDEERIEYLKSWISVQIESNLKRNICFKPKMTECRVTYKDGPPYFNRSGPVYSQDWRGPFTVGNPIHQSSIMDLFISAIKPGTKCTGKYCKYDPPTPTPLPLTCNDKPCPLGQDCCEYAAEGTYTCCAEGQHCDNSTGICE